MIYLTAEQVLFIHSRLIDEYIEKRFGMIHNHADPIVLFQRSAVFLKHAASVDIQDRGGDGITLVILK